MSEENGEAMIDAAISQMKNGEGKAEATVSKPEKTEDKAKSKWVEIDDPAVKERIDDLYKQVKKSDERNQTLIEHQRGLEEALEKATEALDKLTNKQVRDEQEDVLKDIKAQIKQARADGDEDKIDELTERLIDFKAEQKLAKKEPLKVTKKEAPKAPYTMEEAAFIGMLAQETDPETGDYVRPWMHQNHPDHRKSVEIGGEIAREYDRKGKQLSIQHLMRELEKRMTGDDEGGSDGGSRKPQAHSSVLSGGDLTLHRKNNKLELSEDQRYVAKRLGLTDEQLTKRTALIAKARSVSINDF